MKTYIGTALLGAALLAPTLLLAADNGRFRGEQSSGGSGAF